MNDEKSKIVRSQAKPWPKPTSTPTMFQMLRNFSKEVVNYIKEGAPNVTAEDYADRLDACNKCPHLKKESMRCGLCGCMLQLKAKFLQ